MAIIINGSLVAAAPLASLKSLIVIRVSFNLVKSFGVFMDHDTDETYALKKKSRSWKQKTRH